VGEQHARDAPPRHCCETAFQAKAAMKQEHEKGQCDVELFLDAQCPGLRESVACPGVQAEVDGKRCKPPDWLHRRRLPEDGKERIECQHDKKGRENAECTPQIETAKANRASLGQLPEQLGADQEATEHEEDVDPEPSVVTYRHKPGRGRFKGQVDQDDEEDGE